MENETTTPEEIQMKQLEIDKLHAENRSRELDIQEQRLTVKLNHFESTHNQLHEGKDGAIGIIEALAKVSQAIGAIGKDKKNKTQGFNYRSIDAVMSGIHDALAENDIVVTNRHVTFVDAERATKNGGVMYYKEKEHTFSFRYKDGSRLETTMTGSAADSGDKADNKCLSIALKYTLTTLFMIPLQTDDPDKISPEKTTGTKPVQHKTANEPVKASDAQIKKIYAAWTELHSYNIELHPETYTAENKDTKLKEGLKSKVGKDSSKDLTKTEASSIIEGITKKIDEAKIAKKAIEVKKTLPKTEEPTKPIPVSERPPIEPSETPTEDDKLEENIQKMKERGNAKK